MKITNKLSDYRKKNEMTQEDLAKRIGVSRQTIIAIEKGNYVPSLLLAFKICKVFDVSTEKMFSLEL